MIFVCLVVAMSVAKGPIPAEQSQHVCSVPLLKLHVDHPEKFAIPTARAPHKDRMPVLLRPHRHA